MLALLAMAALAAGPEVHGQLMPRSDVPPPPGAVEDPGMGVTIAAWGASTPTPPIHVVPDRLDLAVLLAFEQTILTFDHAPSFAPTAGRLPLFRAQAALVAAWTVSERATVLGLVQPGLYTDLGGPMSGHDVGVVGMIVATWRFTDGLTAGAGGGYVQLFGHPTFTPFLALDAEVGRLAVHALAPREAELWLRLADPARVGAFGTLDGGFYHVHPGLPDVPDAFQEYSVLAVGGAAELTVGRLRLTLSGGRALRRELTVYANATTPLVDFAAAPGWAARAELGIVLDP